jgi:hypothetical protein
MNIEHYKKMYEDGTVYYRSIFKYQINGVKKQINVDAYSPVDTEFFLNIIKNRQYNEQI